MTLFSVVVDADARRSKIREAQTRAVSERIRPARPPEVVRFDETAFAITLGAPRGRPRAEQRGVFLGHCIEGDPWMDPLAGLDGTFVVVRVGPDEVRVLTDATASFSAFTATTEGGFMVTNSQRLAVAALGDFQENTQALPWLLATGYLGGSRGAWDHRLEAMQPRTTGIFTRSTSSWRTHPNITRPSGVLSAAIEESLEAHRRVKKQSILALSGGLDSLALAGGLCASGPGPASVSWGVQGAADLPGTDANVAGAAALRLGCDHHSIAVADRDPATYMHEFVARSEGRIDHVAGYTDAFATWSKIRSLGKEFVLRGDEGFGWLPVYTERDVRIAARIPTFADQGLPYERSLGITSMKFPPSARRGSQTLAAWRDSVYRGSDLPRVLAALSTTKALYVETLNPFLTRKILDAVRALPDKARTDKAAFREWAKGIVKEPLATKSGASTALASDEALSFLWGTLRRDTLPSKLVGFLQKPQGGGSRGTPRPRWKRALKAGVPQSLRAVARNLRPGTYSPSKLLWRAWLAAETRLLLRADADAATAAN